MPEHTEIPLLTPQTMICDDHAWRFPTTNAAPGGFGRLRIWTTAEGPLLAIVTECGIGTSTINAAEGLHKALRERFGPIEFVVFNHWPAEQRQGKETLDHVVLDDDGSPGWDPVITVPEHPHHVELEAWMREHGRRLLDEGGPWVVPAELADRLSAVITRADQEHWDELFRLAGWPPER